MNRLAETDKIFTDCHKQLDNYMYVYKNIGFRVTTRYSVYVICSFFAELLRPLPLTAKNFCVS